MDLKEAVNKARLILDEEELRPTLNYRWVSTQWPLQATYYSITGKSEYLNPAGAGLSALYNMRSKRHERQVFENPNDWEFESTNYNLLTVILSQVNAEDKRLFVTQVLSLSLEKPAFKKGSIDLFPFWNFCSTALPLVAEFCIRNNFLNLVIAALNKVKYPNSNIAGMMAQMEEMISLNFDLFSDAELSAMPEALKSVREVAHRQTYFTIRTRGGSEQTKNKFYKEGFSASGAEVRNAVDAFLVQCAQARYWYLKGALQQSRNLEVEADKKAVEDYLTKLGFDSLMVKSLNAAEKDFRSTATAFELKNCLGHLRSFLEQLHLQASFLLVSPGETPPDKWGTATAFLRHHLVITLKEEEFITKLYTLVSDEAIHPLIAGREYARLFRNIVIEYGLLFLATLQKNGGVKIKASNP